MEVEFEKIDENGGGQVLFGEFVKWALDKNLDIEDDVDETDSAEQFIFATCFCFTAFWCNKNARCDLNGAHSIQLYMYIYIYMLHNV